MSTFILRLDTAGDGPRLAVKDLIDMEGLPTTAGCRALAADAQPAGADAACLAGARAARARIVGKVNLHELAFGASGVNPWYGTPVNPLDPARVPGGSSSGSAVAVATGEADVAYGSDTGGSVRIPSACCGTTGLKTTWGRVPLAGVWPLAPSLDTIGPMARDVAGVELGMRLLEPGFTAAADAPTVVGRFRLAADPALDVAVDAALAASGFEVVDVELPGWDAATVAAVVVLLAEAWDVDQRLLAAHPDGVGVDVVLRLEAGRVVMPEQVQAARDTQGRWQAELAAVFERVQLVALPTLTVAPPLLGDESAPLTAATAAVNLSGHPALALPVPAVPGASGLPASLQLVGPPGGEELCLAAGRVVEAAVAR